MADKKITDLELRTNVDDDVNVPVDDGIQSYRTTAPQWKSYIFPNASVTKAKLAAGAMSADVKSKTADFTLTTAEDIVLGDSSGGAFTLTLPTAVGITGKIYLVKKTDSSDNAVTIATTSSQTMNGVTSMKLATQWDFLRLISDGANWQILDGVTTSEVWTHTANGNGSTSTKYRRFTTVQRNIGSAITYSDSSTDGGKWIVNESGVYAMTWYDGANPAAGTSGITRNDNQPTTDVQSTTTEANILAIFTIGTAFTSVSVQKRLKIGDEIRCKCATANYVANCGFTITKVSI